MQLLNRNKNQNLKMLQIVSLIKVFYQ